MDKQVIKIIDFSLFNGIRIMRTTHYYLNGKRISAKDYVHTEMYLHNAGYEWVDSRQYSDKNKNGVTRDYTVITYERKAARSPAWCEA